MILIAKSSYPFKCLKIPFLIILVSAYTIFSSFIPYTEDLKGLKMVSARLNDDFSSIYKDIKETFL